MTSLASVASQAIEKAAAALGTRVEPLQPSLDELPALTFDFPGFSVPRASLLAFSRDLQATYIERHLRNRLRGKLDERLAAHSALLAAWARRSIEQTRAAFEEQAEPLRSAFAELRRPSGEADDPGLRGDLDELDALASNAEDNRRTEAERRTG